MKLVALYLAGSMTATITFISSFSAPSQAHSRCSHNICCTYKIEIFSLRDEGVEQGIPLKSAVLLHFDYD